MAESKREKTWNNRAAVIPVVTYSNNKVWRQEGERRVCVCVCVGHRDSVQGQTVGVERKDKVRK